MMLLTQREIAKYKTPIEDVSEYMRCDASTYYYIYQYWAAIVIFYWDFSLWLLAGKSNVDGAIIIITLAKHSVFSRARARVNDAN